jgi:hypothetical protein
MRERAREIAAKDGQAPSAADMASDPGHSVEQEQALERFAYEDHLDGKASELGGWCADERAWQTQDMAEVHWTSGNQALGVLGVAAHNVVLCTSLGMRPESRSIAAHLQQYVRAIEVFRRVFNIVRCHRADLEVVGKESRNALRTSALGPLHDEPRQESKRSRGNS